MTLVEEFRQMCQTYFPHWREAAVWCLEEGSHAFWSHGQGEGNATTAQGYCDPTIRRITLYIPPEHVLQRQAAILHAICHAITTVGHGALFRAQMHLAATRAVVLGASALAAELRRQATASQLCGCLMVTEATILLR